MKISLERVSIFCTGNWSGNLNYWTGGFQSCKGTWGFCQGTKFKRLSSDVLWASDQSMALPPKDNCMHLRVNRKSSENTTTLSAKNCSNKYIYACQVCNSLPTPIGAFLILFFFLDQADCATMQHPTDKMSKNMQQKCKISVKKYFKLLD
jgi:hypothetical protein